ncbi:ABC transporter permease [Roseivirga sp.]|uniref:ABC transporter permease n=1 Tax=Roseivirga sp. TaxID=1964215 RepID=UPI003B8B9A39
MFKNNFKIAFRNLVKKREFTLINVFGLMVGLTTSLLIFLWVNDEINYDGFHSESERIHMVMSNNYSDNGEISTGWNQNGIIKNVLDSDFPEVEKALRVDERDHQLTVGDISIKQTGLLADEEFFQVFSYPLIEGRITEETLATGGDIMLTESMALRLFKRTDVIGEMVKIDNNRDAIVRAVVSDPPKNSRFEFSFAISMEHWIKENDWIMKWGNSGIATYVKLAPNADNELVTDKISDLLKKNNEGDTRELFLKPFDDIYLKSNYENGVQSGGRIEYVRLLSLIGVFIIFIACINFINLSVADAFKRVKEVGVRKVNGASRFELIKQFFTESGLIVFFSFLLSIVAVEVLISPFNDLTGKFISLNWLDGSLLFILAGLAIFTMIISGVYPALVLSGFRVVKALKGKVDVKGTSGTGRVIRKGLVLFQFVIAGILIFATWVVNNQVEFILNGKGNIDKEGVVMLYNHGDLLERFDSFKAELLKSPSILSTTVVAGSPLNIGSATGNFEWEGKDPLVDKTSFRLFFSEEDFVPTMNLEIVEGRNFSSEIESDNLGILVNEATVRGMNVEEPVGMAVNFWGVDTKIIGVIKDFHIASVYEEIQPLIIVNYPENSDYVTIKIAPGQEGNALKKLEETYADFMPGYLFEYKFLDAEHERMYQSELLIKNLATIFGLIAIAISCLGLFGLTSINAQRSIKEIGIRKVLGASLEHILVKFTIKSLVLPLLAMIIMAPIAYYLMSQWLEGFVYHVDFSGIELFIVMALSLAIAWLTVVLISFKAAKTNPINSLRSE